LPSSVSDEPEVVIVEKRKTASNCKYVTIHQAHFLQKYNNKLIFTSSA
jgi:hypothetical protein